MVGVSNSSVVGVTTQKNPFDNFFQSLCSFLPQVVGLGQLSELDPVARVTVSQDSYSAPHSDIIRFSLTSLHFIIIAIVLVSLSTVTLCSLCSLWNSIRDASGVTGNGIPFNRVK